MSPWQFIGAFMFPQAEGNELVWVWSQCPILTNFRAGLLTRHYSTIADAIKDVAAGRPIRTATFDFLRY